MPRPEPASMNSTANRAIKRCRGAGSCYFPIAAGPLAVFSKRFVIEFLEDEDGRDMTNRSLLQLRFGQSLACADMSLSFVASGL